MSTFVLCLRAAGLEAQMIAVNCFAPDSLIAARTPLYVGGGNDPWLVTPNAEVAATLDVNGWHSTDGGGTHVLKTGIIPSSVPALSNANGGLTAYMFALANGADATHTPIGCDDISGKFCTLDLGTTAGATYGSDFYAITSNPSSAKVTLALPTIPGYYSGNRTSNTQNDLYFATSTSPHAGIATSVAANPNAAPNREIAVAGFNATGAFQGVAGNTVSFAAIHNGLTAAQSAALFACVQALRQFFGGGFL